MINGGPDSWKMKYQFAGARVEGYPLKWVDTSVRFLRLSSPLSFFYVSLLVYGPKVYVLMGELSYFLNIALMWLALGIKGRPWANNGVSFF